MAWFSRSSKLAHVINEHGLSPESLVGSWFHTHDEDSSAPIDTGQIVAEIKAGTYLVEFYNDMGERTHQGVVDVDRIVEERWSIYDSKEWLDSSAKILALRYG